MKKFNLNGLMKVKMLTVIISAFMLLAGSPAYSGPLKTNGFDRSWKLDKTVNNVDFYYKIVECSSGTIVILAFNNRNDQAVTINWIDVVKTQDGTVESRRGQKQLMVAPGESPQYNCSNSDSNKNVDNIAIINPYEINPIKKSNISSYNFKVISVEIK